MSRDVLTVSSKGQVVLPALMRKSLSISAGDKLVAYARDGAILLKPLSVPAEDELATWLDEMRTWAEEYEVREDEVDLAIAEVRARRKA